MSMRGSKRWWLLVLSCLCARAQDALLPTTTAGPPPTISEKWNFFVAETVTPLTLVAASLDATASQLTRSAPLYGKHPWRNGAFPKRFGATVGDDTSQNFFADFLLASVLHEDTRYVRKGPVRMASHRICHQPGGDYADRCGRWDVQLRQCGWVRDERGAIECVLSSGQQNGLRFAYQLGHQCRGRGIDNAGVRARCRRFLSATCLFITEHRHCRPQITDLLLLGLLELIFESRLRLPLLPLSAQDRSRKKGPPQAAFPGLQNGPECRTSPTYFRPRRAGPAVISPKMDAEIVTVELSAVENRGIGDVAGSAMAAPGEV